MQYWSNSLTVSNTLIIISFIFTVLASINPTLYEFGINTHFLNSWDYYTYTIQLFTGTFLHGWMIHFLTNSLFIYLFGNATESFMWNKKFVIFFIFITLLNWITVTYLNPFYNTVWISGFALAVLAYFTLELRSRNNPEYKAWLLAIFINVAIGFVPWISLIWHLFWAVYGAIFYLIIKKLMK